MGTFECFCNQKSELEHAYFKLKRIPNKPDFATVYPFLESFFIPFIQKPSVVLTWEPKSFEWQDAPK
jgi:hypothetical protein